MFLPQRQRESLSCGLPPCPTPRPPHPHYTHTLSVALQNFLFLGSFPLYINSLQKGSFFFFSREGCFVCWNPPGLPSVPLCTLSFPHTCGKYLGYLVYGLGVSHDLSIALNYQDMPSAHRLSPQPYMMLYWTDTRGLIQPF